MPAKKTAAAVPPKPPAKKTTAKKTAAPRKRAPAKKTAPPGPPASTSPATPGKEAAAPPPPGYIRRQVTSTAKRVAQPTPGKSYHRIVLGEFVVCVVLVFTGSIVTPKVKDGAFVFVHVLVQLTALCGLFFVLALLGGGEKTGKVAAAFGGLVTLGVLLNSTPAIKEIGKIFAPAKAVAPAAPAPGAGSPFPTNKPPVVE